MQLTESVGWVYRFYTIQRHVLLRNNASLARYEGVYSHSEAQRDISIKVTALFHCSLHIF